MYGDALGEEALRWNDSTGLSTGQILISLADEVVKNRGDVRRTFQREDVLTQLAVENVPLWYCAPGLAMPIGVMKRPQDHYGIVDDVITTIEWNEPTGGVAAGACALAAAIAALLDGWGMEGALDLALFTGKRGHTFGTKTSVDVVAKIEAVVDAVDDASVPGLVAQRSHLDLQDEMSGLIPMALGLAYAYRDVHDVVEAVRGWQNIRPEVARCLAGVAGALCAAESLNPLLLQDVNTGLSEPHLDRLISSLAAIRYPDG